MSLTTTAWWHHAALHSEILPKKLGRSIASKELLIFASCNWEILHTNQGEILNYNQHDKETFPYSKRCQKCASEHNKVRFVVAPRENLLWVVLVLKRYGGWQLNNLISLVWSYLGECLKTIKAYWSKHWAVNQRFNQNQHYSKKDSTLLKKRFHMVLVQKNHIIILLHWKASNPANQNLERLVNVQEFPAVFTWGELAALTTKQQ